MRKIRHLIWLLPLAAAGFIIFGILAFAGQHHAPEDRYDELRTHYSRNFSVPVPSKLDFAGEEVPLQLFYVRESLDRELLVNAYWHSSTLLMMKRSWRYFPMIDSVLRAQGIPSDFRYLALIESSLDQVVSPSGAAGLWQFMKATAQSYGLEVNQEIDERYHPLKSTVAACKYLKDAHARFKNWTLAAASYNCGMDAIDKALKSQLANSYYDLNLNRETLRYVYRILAIKVIYNSPAAYGFYLRTNDLYPPVTCKAVRVDSAVVSWAQFAKSNRISYRMLKELNPWLLGNTLTNKEKKAYSVLLPLPGSENYSTLLKNADSSMLFNDTTRVDQMR